MATASVRARLLGGFDLAVAGRAITASAFERPSGLRLLKLLLATPGHRVRREAAAEALWPDAAPERSGANLRKAIHFARRALSTGGVDGDALLVGDGSELRLEGAWDIDADELAEAIGAVERGAASTGQLDALARLGGGALLPSDPYEDWLEPIRESLRQRGLEALLAGGVACRSAGDPARALGLVNRALALEPADERAHRFAIELHLDAGELHAARRQLQACRQAVAEAYGVEPDPALARLIDDVAAQRPRAGLIEPVEAPIVGRHRELERGAAAVDRLAADRRSAVLLLRGPAGIGKSRLLRELAETVRATGWPCVELRGLEDAPAPPFGPLAAAMIDVLGGSVPDSLPEPGRSAIRFADPAAREAAPVAFGSDAAVQRGLLDGLAHVGPPDRSLAIVADDAQWLDRATLDLLDAAVSPTPGGRTCLVLATIRDEPALVTGPVSILLAAAERTGGEQIALGPMQSAEIRQLLERDVAGGPLADDLARSIAELSAGAPLFAADLFRSSRESGLIELGDGGWAFRKGVTALQVPEGIARLVERRISRMGPVARLVLATAAELGDLVAFDDLVATGPSADDVLDAVDAALAAGLVVERGGRYAFAHPLYRAALRRGLPPRDRGSVHRRIASMLASGIDPRDESGIGRAGARGTDLLAIAGHAAAAVELGAQEMAPIAVGFGIGAGQRQAYAFDFAGAVETLRRAIAIWQRMPDAERREYGISMAWVELGQALRRTGDDSGAQAAFRAAIDDARDDEELAMAASAAAWLPYEHGRFAAALAILDEAAVRIREPLARARVESPRGWIIGRDGRWAEAVSIIGRAVESLESAGPSVDLMRALDRLAIAYRDSRTGDPARSIPVLERAVHMAVELGRTGERATFEMHLGGAYRDIGRLDDAVAALDRARSLCRLTGERYIETVVEWMAAEVEETRGDDRAAIDHRRRELEIFSAIGGNPRHEALAHAHIAHLARRLGDTELEGREAEAARIGARHSGVAGLESRIDWALGTDDWFADMPSPPVPGQPRPAQPLAAAD